MAVTRAALLDALPLLAKQRVVVVGDMLLDEYVFGAVSRVSREAPVLVLEHEREMAQPGGGAFPALAVHAMGGEALMIGCVGEDRTGETLVSLLRAAGVDTAGVVTAPERVTPCKTRFVAEGFNRFPQQVARVDKGTRAPVDGACASRLVEAIGRAAGGSAFLLSEYKYGTITGGSVDAVRDAARRTGAVTAVDSQGSLDPYRGFTLVRDNRADAAAYLGEPLETVPAVLHALPYMRDRLDATNVVVSLGGEGLAVIGPAGEPHHIPAGRVDVFDVTGAGDTLIVVMTLALAAGLSLEIAAHLGNLAAGVAVRKLGNATVSAEDLRRAIVEADDALFASDTGDA